MKSFSRYPRRNTHIGFSVFIFVIILAVAVGYAGTKYVIYPYLLGSDPLEGSEVPKDGKDRAAEIDVIPSSPSIIIDQQNIKDEKDEKKEVSEPAVDSGSSAVNPPSAASLNGPFSVQFGSFSSKSGAQALSEELSGKGIYSYVYESKGSYKVLGLPYESEEKAKKAASIVSTAVSDVFVVNLSALIH